jgi:hypothetical protein
MQIKDIPQDPSVLDKVSKVICYATDENGNYVTGKSRGWEIETKAQDVTWQDINTRVQLSRQKVIQGEASPLLFFMELRLMDISMVAAYTGFWKYKVKNHLKPHVFNKLSENKLLKYAEIFDVSLAVLKSMDVNET